MSPELAQLEMECMKVLWRHPGASVAQVRAALPRPLAYTTVMTVLDRMSAKGVVGRHKHGRAYLYSPLLELSAAREHAINRLVAGFFEDDREALLRYLAQGGTAGMRAQARKGGARAVSIPQIDDTLL